METATRYKEGKAEDDFRQYDAKATPRVAEFYRQPNFSISWSMTAIPTPT